MTRGPGGAGRRWTNCALTNHRLPTCKRRSKPDGRRASRVRYVVQSPTVSSSHSEPERRSRSEPPTQEASQTTKPRRCSWSKTNRGRRQAWVGGGQKLRARLNPGLLMKLADDDLAVGELRDDLEPGPHGFENPAQRADVHVVLAFHLGDGGLVHAQRPGEFHLRKTQGQAELLQRNLAKDLIAPGRGAIALLLRKTRDQVGKPLRHRGHPLWDPSRPALRRRLQR